MLRGMATSFLAATGSTGISSTKYYGLKLRSISHGEPSSILLPKAAQSVCYQKLKVSYKVRATAAGSPGLYSSEQFELTPENVDKVLEDVRPYLIADGGNVDVVSVENGVVSLQLQGIFMCYLSSSFFNCLFWSAKPSN